MAGEYFASASGTCTVWVDWNQSYASSTNNLTWLGWTVTSTNTTYYVDQQPYFAPETEEVRAERERKAAERKRREQEAKDRAHALFREALSPSQLEEVERERYFTVESHTSKRRYRIRTDKERHGNIEEVNEQGVVLRSLCGAPGGAMPLHDALLGQKLFLEHAEAEFLEKANVTERRTA